MFFIFVRNSVSWVTFSSLQDLDGNERESAFISQLKIIHQDVFFKKELHLELMEIKIPIIKTNWSRKDRTSTSNPGSVGWCCCRSQAFVCCCCCQGRRVQCSQHQKNHPSNVFADHLFRWLVFAVYGYTYGIGFADHVCVFVCLCVVCMFVPSIYPRHLVTLYLQ